MKVFISWSGERSRQVAELLNEWIGNVLQHVTPWFSPEMDRGSVWFNSIFNALSETSAGIICLTQDNLNSPWILFESGAIAKGVTANRVCTFAIDIEKEDIQAPLSHFNATQPSQEDMYSLVKTLNAASGDEALNENRLRQVFDAFWPQFWTKFQTILDQTNSPSAQPAKRPQEEVLVEILDTVRRIERDFFSRQRYDHALLAASFPNELLSNSYYIQLSNNRNQQQHLKDLYTLAAIKTLQHAVEDKTGKLNDTDPKHQTISDQTES